jgi:hypothetical protein
MPHRAYASTLALLVVLVAAAWAVPDQSRRDVLDTPALTSALAARADSGAVAVPVADQGLRRATLARPDGAD